MDLRRFGVVGVWGIGIRVEGFRFRVGSRVSGMG